MRPIWKGFISFGLVNIPVVLYSAEKNYDIHFKLIDSRDQSRIRYVRTNENTGEEVPWKDIVKGYEYDNGNYVMMKEEEIKTLVGENAKTITILNFIQKQELDDMYLDKPYYLIPDSKNEKGYVILREALKTTKKVGIAKVMIHTREYLAAVETKENALILNILRYDQELRKENDFSFPLKNLKSYKISKKEMEVAEQLISSMTVHWKPAEYKDEFREQLEKWIEDKIHHEKPKKLKSIKKQATSNVINFVDLLKKSLKEKPGLHKMHRHKKSRKELV